MMVPVAAPAARRASWYCDATVYFEVGEERYRLCRCDPSISEAWITKTRTSRHDITAAQDPGHCRASSHSQAARCASAICGLVIHSETESRCFRVSSLPRAAARLNHM